MKGQFNYVAYTFTGDVEDEEGNVIWSKEDEEPDDAEDWAMPKEDDDETYHAREMEIEEEVICWYVSNGLEPQTCSKEDLECGGGRDRIPHQEQC